MYVCMYVCVYIYIYIYIYIHTSCLPRRPRLRWQEEPFGNPGPNHLSDPADKQSRNHVETLAFLTLDTGLLTLSRSLRPTSHLARRSSVDSGLRRGLRAEARTVSV